jgi:hypothetical protein
MKTMLTVFAILSTVSGAVAQSRCGWCPPGYHCVFDPVMGPKCVRNGPRDGGVPPYVNP